MLCVIIGLRPMIGLVAIAVCTAAWHVDLAGITYVCPFCRAQQTVIGMLGILCLLPA